MSFEFNQHLCKTLNFQSNFNPGSWGWHGTECFFSFCSPFVSVIQKKHFPAPSKNSQAWNPIKSTTSENINEVQVCTLSSASSCYTLCTFVQPPQVWFSERQGTAMYLNHLIESAPLLIKAINTKRLECSNDIWKGNWSGQICCSFIVKPLFSSSILWVQWSDL